MKATSRLASAALLFALAPAGVGWAADYGQAPESGTKTYEPDNTGRNVRDRDAAAKTPGDQSNDPADVRVTQEIRRAVTQDDSLSTNAQNVKIITVAGVVTLRGPVNSADERARIQAAAEKVAGVKRVENQLEVTSR